MTLHPIAQTLVRTGWIDTARGIAIVLVALGHSILYLVPEHLAVEQWFMFGWLVSAFWMQLFFVLTGLLARRVLQRTWRELWNDRLGVMVWCIVVWSVVRFAGFSVFPLETRPEENDPMLLLLSPVLTTRTIWFLQATVVYLVLAKLFADRVPVWAQFVLGGALAAVYLAMPAATMNYERAASYLLYFLVGLHCGPLVERLTARSRPVIGSMLLFGGIVCTGLVVGLRIHVVVGVIALISVPTVAGALMFARAIDTTPIGRLTAMLGRNGLQIFLIHVPVIAVLVGALAHVQSLVPAPLLVLSPLIVTPLVLMLSTWIGSLLTRWVPWSFALPDFLRVRAPATRVATLDDDALRGAS